MEIPSFCMIMQAIYTCFWNLSRELLIKIYVKYNKREGPANDAYIMHLCTSKCIKMAFSA
jgi:hypothetical protein